MNQENNFSAIWNQSKTRDERETIPDGKYTAVMSNVKAITGKTSGKRMMVVEFEIRNPGGDGDKQKLSKFFLFNEIGLGNLKTDLGSMNREIGNPTSEDDCVQKVYDLCPTACSVFVQSKLDKTGTMRQNIYINGPADSAMDDDQLPF